MCEIGENNYVNELLNRAICVNAETPTRRLLRGLRIAKASTKLALYRL
jgi:hypothetical protein